jgi:hypothetical protein
LGVGFQLLGRFERTLSSPDEILREMEKWVRKYCFDLAASTRIGFSETTPTLFCQLHPAAEELELAVLDLDHFAASAKTSTVGPGFHIFLCDMLRKLGKQFGVQWETSNEDYFDEADYFSTGNQNHVFEEMARWLNGLSRCFFEGTFAEEAGDMPTVLCLPIGVAFEADARAVTPLGPRDVAWLKKVAADGSAGRDFFAWWNPALNAEYFLGRALVRMWTNVRWRKPVNDGERETLNYVANSLETALKLDPQLSYPWAEWAEILDFLERDGSESEQVRWRGSGTAKIGYRRRNVAQHLPGHWIIKLPGSFSEFEADEEGDFFAQDPPRTIWFTSYNFVDEPERMFTEAYREVLQKRPALLEERDGYIARAEINQKTADDGEYFVLSSSNICRKGRSVLTIIFTSPEERSWAENVWRSLQSPKA